MMKPILNTVISTIQPPQSAHRLQESKTKVLSSQKIRLTPTALQLRDLINNTPQSQPQLFQQIFNDTFQDHIQVSTYPKGSQRLSNMTNSIKRVKRSIGKRLSNFRRDNPTIFRVIIIIAIMLLIPLIPLVTPVIAGLPIGL